MSHIIITGRKLEIWGLPKTVGAEAPTRRQRRDDGWIYYLKIDDRIKIGFASHLGNRLRQYPPTAKFLAAHPGTRADETALHERFRGYLMEGREWYAQGQPIREHIAQMAAEHPTKDPRAVKAGSKDTRTPQQRQADPLRWPRKGVIRG